MGRVVVVIGAGYGGAAVAKALDAEADVVLIDPRDAFVNTVGSLRALTQPDWARSVFFPLDRIVRRGRVVRDRAVSVDPGGVTLASGGRVEADYLVLATGSGYTFPAKPSVDSTNDALEAFRRGHKELAAARRVLILGAGPVGLELAGEIREVWSDKHVIIVDPAEQLLPGFLPEVREELRRQLDELGIEVRLGTSLSASPATESGRAETFTVTTTAGDQVTADIWFRAHGMWINSDFLADGALTNRTPQGQVRVTEKMNITGYSHIYSIGDLTDVAEPKQAGFAMRHADVVARNIGAQLRGEAPEATYSAVSDPMMMVPLGPRGGVGQLATADGPVSVPVEKVAEMKGADLLTGKFSELFGG